MKKKTLIAAAAVLLIGLCALLFGRLARQKTSDMMHLTDGSTGRSVVVEWSDSDMFVNELDACTNSVLTPGDDYGKGADDRLPTILAALQQHDGTLSPDEVRELLAAVAQKNYTEWSFVYDLNRFSADIWLDERFDTPHHFGAES